MRRKKFVKKGKFIFIGGVLSIIFMALVGRLFYLMVVIGLEYKSKAVEQQTTTIQISAKRGEILDRNSNELVINEDIYRIDLDLKTLRKTLSNRKMSFSQLADKLSPILNMKSKDILKVLNTTLPDGLPANSALLKRQIEKPIMEQIKALNIRGIIISPDTKRYYVNGNFMTSILGLVNSEGKGVSGVELSYDKELSGTPGSTTYEKDGENNPLPYEPQVSTQPIQGKDVILTIDSAIQEFAEQAAEKALEDNKAKGVNIIVMNPQNGEILAMANKPSLDLNNTSNISNNSKEAEMLWKNSSVQDNFEPGSIFKVITAACALENNIGLNDTYTCDGSIKIDGTTIHCWNLNGHGSESFVDIIKNSCNVGFAELGNKLGKEKLVATAKKMGFGQKTGIDLPGESAGILKSPAQINKVDLSELSFGQGVAVNQIQYMTAFDAIANGGIWIIPHIMKDIAHADDTNKEVVDRKYDNYGKKNVYDPELASELRQDLIKVVTEGVGKNAFVQGLDIAGKTGTAEIADPTTGTYAPGKYMSSFAGMAPAGNPKITLLVSINQPSGSSYYAGDVSAPVAKTLFQEIFNYIAIKGERDVLN
ncbi:penicillin-binding transpeptidase domain-containing protein [Clostridium sp. WILCCON 0269]|uniref:Penicillin-binding transpeptidase domain-containing protein n=1 Tax=Candidatus Clostridium eludens TaxID=3381663 RepID=A0ABW8SLC5_9CLOT